MADYSDLYASQQPVEKTVNLPEGERALYFREMTVYEAQKFAASQRSNDDEKRIAGVLDLIAAVWVNADGTAATTPELVRTLKREAADAIFGAIFGTDGADEGNG